MKNIEQKVINFIKEHKLLEKGDKVIVAFSGGPDSLFALYFLSKYKKLFGLEIFAFHLNHNLRGKSAQRDENFSKDFASGLNVKLKTVSLDVKLFADENKLSVEEAARILRYRELDIYANEIGANKIITAHNKNDFAETVLLNFSKGCGLSGLKGIPIRRGKIIRPFLILEKSEILDYLKTNKLDFCIDESNLENLYQRNYLRNKIIPEIKKNINPNFESAVLKNFVILQEQESLFNKLIEEKKAELVSIDKDIISISLEKYDEYGTILYTEIIKRLLKSKFDVEFYYSIAESIKNVISNQKGKSVDLGHNLILLKESDKMILKKMKLEEVSDVIEVAFNKNYNLGYININIEEVENDFKFSSDYELLKIENPNQLIIRNWRAGDKFIPLGMKGFKKVSDFLTDIKVDNHIRDKVKVLESEGEIVYLIGFRIDERYKIEKQNKRAIKVWKK